MNKTEPNFFLGIRTPWTIADAEVWARTHRIGGWAFMALGVCLMIGGVVLEQVVVMMIIIVGSCTLAIGLVGYSYWLYRKLNA